MSDAYFPEMPGEEEHSERSRWRDRVRHVPRAAIIAGLAAVLAVGGAGVAFAAGSGSSSTTTPTTTAPSTKPGHVKGPNGPHGPFGRGGPGAFGGLGRLGIGALGGGVVHGTVIVRSGSGYKTVDIQVGGVTGNPTSTSITVTSADGFTQTYAVTSQTLVNSQAAGINSVQAKDQVSVIATVSGGKATATNIVDFSKIKNSWKSFGFGPPTSGSSGSNGPAGSGGTPAPPPTTGTASTESL
jgi:hypothetical protein